MIARRFDCLGLGVRFIAFFIGLLALAGLASAQTQHVQMAQGSSVTVDITNVYGGIPAQGYLPLRVVINNGSNADGEWTISSQSNQFMGSEYNFATNLICNVPAHASRTFEMLAPFAYSASYGYGNNRRLVMYVAGPDVDGRDLFWNDIEEQPDDRKTTTRTGLSITRTNTAPVAPPTPPGTPATAVPASPGPPPSPPSPPSGRRRRGVPGAGPVVASPVVPNAPGVFLGLSANLFRDHGDDVKDYLKVVCLRRFQLAEVDPVLLSTDWRAYIGFDTLIFTANDWVSAAPAARAAMLQWVASGGDLRLVADQDGGLDLPARTNGRYGAGFLTVFTESEAKDYDFSWERSDADERYLYNVNFHHKPFVDSTASPENSGSDAYVDHIPHLQNEYAAVALLILLFAILVGPVNLYLICWGPRRQRLLWVVPLMSLVASVVLIAYIIFSEGIGGDGIYFRVTQLLPDGKFAVVAEEESSKTGVLLGRSFTFEEPAWIQPLDHHESRREVYEQEGAKYTGDWLASRQEQTDLLFAIKPSRAAVYLASAPDAASAPILRSEYTGWLENVYYLDSAGKAWKIAKLANGQSAPLEPATMAELRSAWTKIVVSSPAELHEYLHSVSPQPGTFFAFDTSEDNTFQPALTGMRWTNYRHVVTGTAGSK